jgi:hypothetical protein
MPRKNKIQKLIIKLFIIKKTIEKLKSENNNYNNFIKNIQDNNYLDNSTDEDLPNPF